MAKDNKKITLTSEALGDRDFEFAHAGRIVALEHKNKKVNWTPTKGSKFDLIDGALIPGTNKAETKAAEEQG